MCCDVDVEVVFCVARISGGTHERVACEKKSPSLNGINAYVLNTESCFCPSRTTRQSKHTSEIMYYTEQSKAQKKKMRLAYVIVNECRRMPCGRYNYNILHTSFLWLSAHQCHWMSGMRSIRFWNIVCMLNDLTRCIWATKRTAENIVGLSHLISGTMWSEMVNQICAIFVSIESILIVVQKFWVHDVFTRCCRCEHKRCSVRSHSHGMCEHLRQPFSDDFIQN